MRAKRKLFENQNVSLYKVTKDLGLEIKRLYRYADKTVDINKIKAWYLKNKMLNQIEELYFEDNSELRNIGTIHTEDLESGIPYISRDGDIYVYLDKRNGYYNFYYDTPWYLVDSVIISYYANKKYRTLPKFYRMDKLSDKVIIEMARKNAESYLKIKTRKFDIWKVV